MIKIIQGPTYHTATESIANVHLKIDQGKVILLPEEISASSLYPENYHIIPGMIDMHIHGSKGADIMDATPEALQTIADSLLEQGTTAFLATTMSDTPEKIEQALSNIASFISHQTRGATILGIHLEGPFIAKHYVGAQRSDVIIPPSLALFKHWQSISNNTIKMVTLAPEYEGALAFIHYLRRHNIIASFGHSAATYAQTQRSVDAGITHATHLFNAMRGIHHREPGAVTALLLRDEVYAELICDNHHLSPSIIDLSYRLKSADKLVLVTDATRAQCMREGEYELGGQTIILKDKAVRLKDGTLAGSVLTLPEAIKSMLAASHCSMNDIVKMTSTNPATQLNTSPRGLVLLNEDYQIVQVFA